MFPSIPVLEPIIEIFEPAVVPAAAVLPVPAVVPVAPAVPEERINEQEEPVGANVQAGRVNREDSGDEEAPDLQLRACVICFIRRPTVMFLPCAHLVACTQCNELHKRQTRGVCPVCRGHITRRVKTFFA